MYYARVRGRWHKSGVFLSGPVRGRESNYTLLSSRTLDLPGASSIDFGRQHDRGRADGQKGRKVDSGRRMLAMSCCARGDAAAGVRGEG